MLPIVYTPKGDWEAERKMLAAWIANVRLALTGNVGFDNLYGEVKTVTWNATELAVSVASGRRPKAILVLAASVPTDPTTVWSGCAVSWVWKDDGNATIKTIATIPAGTYDVTLWLVGG